MSNRNAKGQFVKTSTKSKLLTALQKGDTFTAKQASKRFGVPATNVSKRISELRSEGYCVYGNTQSGTSEVVYRLGTPSKAIVAAGFRALRESGMTV